MSLNVKDPEAYRLAQTIARTTGQSLTRVVTEALRDKLQSLERRTAKPSVEELLSIAGRAAAHVRAPYADHADLLYDDNGLPK